MSGAVPGACLCGWQRAARSVVAVDPADASLRVAKAKPGADQVKWIHGGVAALPILSLDLAVMTGNVAQVFVGGDEWAHVLRVIA